MSYDYNELVSKISSNRRLAAESEDNVEKKLQHLQEAVDTFESLSTQCPMTPLLWMQYSSDTAELLETLTSNSALDTHLQLLELALAEFPGSAILHLRYLQLLKENSNDIDDGNRQKLKQGIKNAIQTVGKGSHRNEGEIIAAIYRIDAEQGGEDDALTSFFQRARIPMRNSNDSLNSEFQEFCMKHGKQISPKDLHTLESGRRYEAKVYSSLVTFEDEIDATMHSGGILPRHQTNLEDLNWETILRSDGKTFWMGFGGLDCANSFIQYAKACHHYRKPLDYQDDEYEDDGDDIESKVKSLALSVYERGVAECPTAESLWLSYIQHLLALVEKNDIFLPRLTSVVDRSVRNCPYSLALFQQKIRNILLFSNRGKSVLDPDDLMKIVKEALDGKFIASKEACLELHMTAIQTLRRRILSLLVLPVENTTTKPLSYDEAEAVNAILSSTELDDDVVQEIEDLCDDIREMYDAVDQYFRKQFSSWSEGRSYLWLDRSFTESYLIGPLIESLREGRTTGPITQVSELIRCYEKVTKIHQPAHPQSFISYIKGFLVTFPISGPCGVLSKLRQVRWLYQKALKSVGKPKQQQASLIDLDYETSLRSLCHEYLNFERYFGSDTSLANASKVIQKKLTKILPASTQQVEITPTAAPQSQLQGNDTEMKDETEESGGKKRSRENEEDVQPTKKMKGANDEPGYPEKSDNSLDQATKKTDLRVPKPFRHKVKVGNMEYPAHPYTVRVSNLADVTEDMDLVDAFRTKCGGIVHAKIMREKHHHHGKAKSKGWGLIQFEERDSVEKALELNDVIGINEKLVKVERSHLSAVLLVPSGMHRVNPKGKGKNSKLNQKKASNKPSAPISTPVDPATKPKDSKKEDTGTGNDLKANKPSNSSAMGVLAFRPRGVAKIKTQRKAKIALSGTSKEEE